MEEETVAYFLMLFIILVFGPIHYELKDLLMTKKETGDKVCYVNAQR